jgi:A/G-specific adenine glycosylase
MRSELQRPLLDWFTANRRDLPWRRTRDPYAVWISEAMLQQTRVEVVVPYYERFLARLPDVRALAEAAEEEVLALWSGLGYYRRARSLRAAARRLVDDHGGVFPRTRSELLELPGVGPYTAGAILSIAFGLSEPLVDGNVARVLSRLFGLREPVGSGASTRRLWALADDLVPARGAGDWNQALMELGATVCTSASPVCSACPLRASCVALREDAVSELPRRVARRAPVDVQLEVLVVRRGRAVLLVRRPERGRMAGLWELPTREVVDEGGEGAGLWPGAHVVLAQRGETLRPVKHSITHHRIRAEVRAATLDEAGPPETVESCWAAPEELRELALTGLSRKVLGSPRLRVDRTRPIP